jgi:hypothetical protein
MRTIEAICLTGLAAAAALTLGSSGCGDDETTAPPTTTTTTSGSGGSTSSSGTGGTTTSSGTAGGGGSTTSSGTGGSGGGGACGLPVDCAPVFSGFTPCGGDVTGDWALQTICLEKPLASAPSCTQNESVLGTGQASGTVSFSGGGTGGGGGAGGAGGGSSAMVSYTNYQVAAQGTSKVDVTTPACSIIPNPTCQQIEDVSKMLSPTLTICCAMTDATFCECESYGPLEDVGSGSFSASYSTNGNTLTIDGSASEYCVDTSVTPNVLTIRSDGGTDDESVQVLTKM